MPTGEVTLQSLTSVIESLQDAIRRDGRTIGANETRTRNTLIDPLLRALGWADPAVVTQEYLVRYGAGEFDYGVVDYALHPPEDRANPTAFLEAKRMREDLTDDHRDQVLTYALNKGGKLRQFALTNGDQWELYELKEGEPRKIFKFSLKKQTASDCARLLLSHFPKNANLCAKDTPAHTTISPYVSYAASPLPYASRVLSPTSAQLSRTVDVPKVLIWFVAFLFLGGLVGYMLGFFKADPDGDFFAFLGAFAFVVILFLAGVLLQRFFPSILRGTLKSLPLNRALAPIRGNKRKTLTWIGIAILGGGVGSGVLGYFIGLRTAQPVVDAFSVLGLIIFIAIIGLVIVAAVIGSANRSHRKSRRRWR